ncbi:MULTISPECIES: spore coat protein [Bacillaceae]|uniref:spore coat protein n=1 Tax=Bacillaceae TaxID=186817 RepID=UPI001E5DFAC5|nr:MULTISPECIES: spore coat protein [Bacillaceae]MCE4051136.1 spore coat protein [Bacillus sp. Au-Bac7]MCM3030259.1 spore coat protein [Niallia sp. MER 6]MDL0436860.1 spore coat protein [Niallia sp. SS-2023]UPO88231.1 spore coat protein [Niallia sp. Man26]
MASEKLAVHETLELHEVLTLKQSCLVKSYALQSLVEDDTLKMILSNDVSSSEKAIKELQAILSK